jgi:hypothetical protein
MKSSAETHLNEKRKFLTLIRDVAGMGATSIDPEVVDRAFVEVLQMIMDGVVFKRNTFEAVPASVVDNPEEFICELGSVGLHSHETVSKEKTDSPSRRSLVTES